MSSTHSVCSLHFIACADAVGFATSYIIRPWLTLVVSVTLSGVSTLSAADTFADFSDVAVWASTTAIVVGLGSAIILLAKDSTRASLAIDTQGPALLTNTPSRSRSLLLQLGLLLIFAVPAVQFVLTPSPAVDGSNGPVCTRWTSQAKFDVWDPLSLYIPLAGLCMVIASLVAAETVGDTSEDTVDDDDVGVSSSSSKNTYWWSRRFLLHVFGT